MSTKIGVGYSLATNSKKAGMQAAQNALEKGAITKPSFALLFCSGKQNPHEFSEGVHEVLGDIPMLGGSAMGLITDDMVSYEGYAVGVNIFESDTLTFKIFSQPDLNLDEYKTGIELGKKIAAGTDENDNSLLVFYDSSKQQNPPMLNFATLLFGGLAENIPKHMTIAGGGFLADMQLNTCYQFINDKVETQHAIALALGNCNMTTTILHGCKPASAYLTITKTHGPVVLEINNRPALDMIDELVGGTGLEWKDFALFVTLGVNKGEKFGPFNEKEYANRLTLAVDESSKSLIMFEPDLKPGDEVQLMRRSYDLDYVHKNAKEAIRNLDGKPLLFSLYINCAGRAKPYAGGEFEDAEELQKALGNKAPFMGFYSGVEVAKVGEKIQPLDWTGVLCMFSE